MVLLTRRLLYFALILGWCGLAVVAAGTADTTLQRRNLVARSPQNNDNAPDRNSKEQTSNNNNNNNNSKEKSNSKKDSGSNASKNAESPKLKDEPAARLIMEQPSLTMGEVPRYAIGSNITFKWKYDENLRVPPRYLAFEITRDRRAYATIANISYEPTEYTWQTQNWTDESQTFFLSEDRYYLFISDERGRDGNGSSLGGHLAPYSSTYFYLYNPGSGICIACMDSAAPSSLHRRPFAWEHLLLPVLVVLSHDKALARAHHACGLSRRAVGAQCAHQSAIQRTCRGDRADRPEHSKTAGAIATERQQQR
ncbi:hypothetical protein SYNPS1DRAFT_29288 [Syncephalis pseudoplumigaleata]|uniref:DUF7137 domain-containing protein n=1 Tax=Syncephalis pseudoplumigaleata TaxID=1712513 RepID=A0A4V1J1G4_9FUNG|nr:hypothetical protein SYNPS1DRAFT_29288 [Syncephalis pseudoplumigaleata]|eukprot:RKP24969.1 hypothetical protein SYNPS1DRAFT_29288 [Syncephalis pseudoplumigaleata]